MDIEEMGIWGLSEAIFKIIEQGFVEDPETGEIIFCGEDLEKLEEAFDKKINNIAGYIKYSEAKVEAFKSRKKDIDALIKLYTNKAEGLSKFLKEYMMAHDKEKLDTDDHKISFRKSKSSNISNIEALMEWINKSQERKDSYLKFKEPEINKDALKKYVISEEVDIPGFEIIENKSLQIK